VTPEEIVAEAGRYLPASARWLEESVTAAWGGGAAGVTVDVAPEDWLVAVRVARDVAGCGFFDWLTAVDEQERGFTVVMHLYSIEGRHHLLVRTLVPRDAPVLASATGMFRGADWAERETHEMFGVVFEGHPGLAPLLLPGGFEGHPLRKDFALAARAVQDWPGLKEPGERQPSARSRRRFQPPGVPEGWPVP
jgi:NADH-quinone oxidoreductase subunit C